MSRKDVRDAAIVLLTLNELDGDVVLAHLSAVDSQHNITGTDACSVSPVTPYDFDDRTALVAECVAEGQPGWALDSDGAMAALLLRTPSTSPAETMLG